MRRDQRFHGGLPMLALGYCRRQRQDEDTGIAQGSEFTAIAAGGNRIIKLAGPALLIAAGPAQSARQISKEGATSR